MWNQTGKTRSRTICWGISRICCDLAVLFCCYATLFNVQDLCADDDSVTRGRVDELIRNLDGSTLAERSRAERQLLDLGPDVLRLLPAPELIESVSGREAIRRNWNDARRESLPRLHRFRWRVSIH
jgi:hypothetical protein